MQDIRSSTSQSARAFNTIYCFSIQLFRERLSNKTVRDNAKGTMGNGGSWSLIEALCVSAAKRETSQTNLFMPSLFLLVNTVNLNQSTPNSFYP